MMSGGLASLISMHSPYWFFPLIFISISLIGFNLKKSFVLDTGILLSVISYLFVNRGLQLKTLNILYIIGIFFLFVAAWFCAKNTLMVQEMINAFEVPDGERFVSFRRSSLTDLFNNLILSVSIAVIGSFIGIFSSLGGGLSADLEIILMVVFSSLVFFIMYVITNLLSKRRAE